MKPFLLIPLLLTLCACGGNTIVHEPVTVEVPIPYCPAPPVIPKHEFLVDQLQPGDISDPGKVGQAYKADMTYLREIQRIYDMILNQYSNTSQSFEEVQKRIRELADKMKPSNMSPSQ